MSRFGLGYTLRTVVILVHPCYSEGWRQGAHANGYDYKVDLSSGGQAWSIVRPLRLVPTHNNAAAQTLVFRCSRGQLARPHSYDWRFFERLLRGVRKKVSMYYEPLNFV